MVIYSSTTTGQYICGHVIRVMEKFELNPDKLFSHTTDGATSIPGMSIGFMNKKLMPLEHKV